MVTECYVSCQSPSVTSRKAAAIHSDLYLKDRERVTCSRLCTARQGWHRTYSPGLRCESKSLFLKHGTAPDFINGRDFFICVMAIPFRKHV